MNDFFIGSVGVIFLVEEVIHGSFEAILDRKKLLKKIKIGDE
jgi:hypothetical protein